MGSYIPFPQADDFEKIISILNITNEGFLSDFEKMSMILDNITDRQVSYYLSACAYLGLIETNKNVKSFTKIGNELRNMNSSMQKAELISLILLDPVFNKTYVYKKKFGDREASDVESLIKYYHPECTDSICERRAQTVMSWINWVEENIGE